VFSSAKRGVALPKLRIRSDKGRELAIAIFGKQRKDNQGQK